MKLYLTISFLLATSCIFCQEMNWQQTQNWKLYNMEGRKTLNVPKDSIRNLKFLNLDTDSIRFYLQSVTAWPKEKDAVWMGNFVVSCETRDHELIIVLVSMYGGFMYDLGNKKYYELNNSLKKGWVDYLNRCSERLN